MGLLWVASEKIMRYLGKHVITDNFDYVNNGSERCRVMDNYNDRQAAFYKRSLEYLRLCYL